VTFISKLSCCDIDCTFLFPMAAQRGTTHKFEMTTLVKCFFKGLNTLSNIESGRLKQKIRLVNLSQG
jgi:hypothetical protein